MLDTSRYRLENIYPVSMSEADMNYRIKPAALLNFMQDLAAKSISTIGDEFSCDGLLKNGRGWFLIRYRIEFDNYPTNVFSLKVKTECRGAQKMTTYRDFECFDEDGNRILKAVSSWFIVDLDSKSVINIQKEYPEFRLFEKSDDDLELRKLRPIDSADSEKLFHVRYDDLDMNGHVNNTVYITWAMEALDYEFRSKHNLKNLDIYFKHEVKYGDDIISLVKIDEENLVTEHLIKNADNGEEVCLLKAEFAEI
ncbi:hypothetical protein HDR58_10980 [bacterium]|nr:hypothetical protein [bacterium]